MIVSRRRTYLMEATMMIRTRLMSLSKNRKKVLTPISNSSSHSAKVAFHLLPEESSIQ